MIDFFMDSDNSDDEIVNTESNYQKFKPGNKIKHTDTKKEGTIKYLMNDIREKNRRDKIPSHYYYTIKWNDNTIDTYVSQSVLILL